MGFQFDLDLSGKESIEQVENGDRVPPAWYRASCSDHYEDEAKGGGEYVLEFEIAGGMYDGKKLYYRFKDPAIVEDEKKQRTAANRVGLLAARLGLIDQGALGKRAALDFDKAIGREVVLHVTDQKTDRGNYVGIDYGGIFPLDHEKIPDDERKRLKLPAKGAGGGSSAGAGPAAKKDDFADIL